MQDMKICWLTDLPLARYGVAGGTRLGLAGLTAEKLTAAAPKIVVLPARAEAAQAAAWAKAAGARVVLDWHDRYFETPAISPQLHQLAAQADACSAASPGLAALAKAQSGHAALPVSDPCMEIAAAPQFAPAAGNPLRLAWYGEATDLPEISSALSDLIAYAQERPLSLSIVCSLPPQLSDSLRRVHEVTAGRMTVTVQDWDDVACQAVIAGCDIVLLPAVADDRGRLRGADRLIRATRAGRLVVAGPAPAYQAFESGVVLANPLSGGLRAAEKNQQGALARLVAGQALVERFCTPTAVAAQWQMVFAAAQQPKAAAPVIPLPSGVKFNLGCGDKILPGYINCDVLSSRGKGPTVDVQCNITKPLPFADNIASEVLAVHVVEHIWRWEVADVLREWRRILQPGGQIILECPNLLSAAQELIKNPMLAAGPGPEGQRSMWVFYGDPRWRDPLMNHCWGYTPQSLAALLVETGFVDVRQEPAQFKLREPRDMRIVGNKPPA